MARNYRDPFDVNRYYHIYNRVVSEAILFRNDQEYFDFLNRYDNYFGKYFNTYAYCLIPNHFHFLVSVKDNIDSFIKKENTTAATKYLEGKEHLNYFLENQLSRMFSGIAIQHNALYKRSGPLFKQGCKRVELKSESKILTQLCYIHHNPIHHGLSNSYHNWKNSSYHAYLSDSQPKVKTSTMIELFGGKEIFHQWHDEFKFIKEENLFNEEVK